MSRNHGGVCGKCGGSNPRPNNAWCAGCHATYMREYRAARREKAKGSEQKQRDRARHFLNTAIRRGQVKRQTTCLDCGSDFEVQAHHVDYDYPYLVEWLCSRCHHGRHGRERWAS